MLRTFAAAIVAVSLIAGPVLAQGTTAPTATNGVPITTGQPAKAGAHKSITKKHVTKVTTTKKHAAKAAKHVKHVKHPTKMKTVG